ncbi:hypothetical protein CAL27_20125 [Bordetella genomosp. 1]|uniref:Uncharacterized protein n=1 Tax=Bordetella genomosp. 1 TaxID=1395607 RepID=A0ABX4EZU2_9BORD|nr:hypothetical protein CAL27_20125 [Bordetella genomosp. 1]
MLGPVFKHGSIYRLWELLPAFKRGDKLFHRGSVICQAEDILLLVAATISSDNGQIEERQNCTASLVKLA